MIASRTRLDFEAHWREHIAPEIPSTKQAEARAFLRPLYERTRQAAEPMHVLDVGCGDGVHALVLAKDCLHVHRYSGIDLSPRAVKLAHQRVSTIPGIRAEFQVADARSLPYRSDSFDVVFSYGVIAYTGSPELILDEMVRVCKPGGLIGVWLYPKMGGMSGALFTFTRLICRWLGRRISKVVVYVLIPLLPILPVRSGINLFNATWRQCAEVVEVNLLPEVLEFYTFDNVLEWFDRRRMEIQFVDQNRPIAVWARA